LVRSDYTQARFDRNAAWLEIERLLGADPFGAGRRVNDSAARS